VKIRQRELRVRCRDRVSATVVSHQSSRGPASVPRVSGAQAGWWALWEVWVDDSLEGRDCSDLFITDDGSIRPNLAQQVWDLLITGSGMETVSGPNPAICDWLHHVGQDYAYGAFEAVSDNVSDKRKTIAPWVGLRLLARITP
jgi:hypothetical protein